MFLLVRAGERNIAAGLEFGADASQQSSVVADVNRHDFFFDRMPIDIGGGESDGQADGQAPVDALDFELPHEGAELGRDGSQLRAAFCDSCARASVPSAARATPWMLDEMSLAPPAASLALRVISLVVALCSSTAAAMVAEMLLI